MYRRRPAVAGAFYSSNVQELQSMIDTYLDDAEVSLKGKVVSIISPHAGYVYSGPVAGYSYKCLMDSDVDVVVVLAPSHRARFDGASVIPEGIYETPLGDVEIDEIIGKQLIGKPGFGFIQEVHEMEHSLEVQVPFLQKVLSSFKIVPIIVGSIDLDICRTLATSIADALKKDNRSCMIVISTDLSHYHSYDTAVSIDGKLLKTLQAFDEMALKSLIDNKESEACGEGPILTGMIASRLLGGDRIEVLKYANSGDTAGSKDQVVGYLAAAIVK